MGANKTDATSVASCKAAYATLRFQDPSATDQHWCSRRYADFVRRAAHRVDNLPNEMRMGDWLNMHKARTWRFAGKQAMAQDGRWSHKLLQLEMGGCTRDPGRPKTCWTDQLKRFAGGDQMAVALDEER